MIIGADGSKLQCHALTGKALILIVFRFGLGLKLIVQRPVGSVGVEALPG